VDLFLGQRPGDQSVKRWGLRTVGGDEFDKLIVTRMEIPVAEHPFARDRVSRSERNNPGPSQTSSISCRAAWKTFNTFSFAHKVESTADGRCHGPGLSMDDGVSRWPSGPSREGG